MEEISNNADAKILRSTASKFRQPPSRSPNYNSSQKPGTKPQVKSCPLCKQAGRSNRHFLSQCTHLPAEDRTFFAKARLTSSLDDEDDPTDSVFFCPPETEDIASPLHPSARIVSCRVSTKQSPHFNAFYRHHPLNLPLDTVRIFKNNTERRTVRRHEHLCQARHTATVVPTTPPNGSHPSPPHPDGSNPPQSFFFSDAVKVDPDNILPYTIRSQFRQVLQTHDEVFNPTMVGYNGTAGPVQASVNMGPVQPPQRKGRVPQYFRDKLVELQQKFDELVMSSDVRRTLESPLSTATRHSSSKNLWVDFVLLQHSRT